MVDMDTGYVGVLTVSGKSLDNFVVRSTASFVEFGHPRSTILEQINCAINVLVRVERAHQSVPAATFVH